MTRQCRYVLKQIKTASINPTEIIFYSEEDHTVYVIGNSQKKASIPKYFNELASILDALVDNGCLIRTQPVGFQLTHKGMHPHEFSFDAAKKFFLHSIVTPIIVSVVTTLLTLLITACFS